MPTFTLFHEAPFNIGKNLLDLDSHAFKAVLSNTAPSQANNTVLADITQIAATGGYVAGGVALTNVTFTETGAGTGIWKFDCDDIAFTASGADIPTHRYLVVYDDTPTSPADPLVGYADWGASSVITNGATRTWTTASGLFNTTVSP